MTSDASNGLDKAWTQSPLEDGDDGADGDHGHEESDAKGGDREHVGAVAVVTRPVCRAMLAVKWMGRVAEAEMWCSVWGKAAAIFHFGGGRSLA